MCNANFDILRAGTHANVITPVPADMASIVGDHNYLIVKSGFDCGKYVLRDPKARNRSHTIK